MLDPGEAGSGTRGGMGCRHPVDGHSQQQDRSMIRQLSLLLALIALAAASASAAIYPVGTTISYSRQYPTAYIPVGIPTAVHVELVNNEGGALSGLYYSEQFPNWLSVQAGTVKLNGQPTTFTYEYGDTVMPGRRSHRWVIDNPNAPGGRAVLGPGDRITIDFTIRATQVSAFQANADGWFALLSEAEDAPVHGWDASAPIIRFVQNTDSSPLAAGNRLAPAYPNPFNPTTTLRFESASEGLVRLIVIDPAGRAVRELAAGVFPAGHHSVVWDGRDDAGERLPTGVYLARLVDDSGLVGTQKLMLLK
jgi:hypothetical protein